MLDPLCVSRRVSVLAVRLRLIFLGSDDHTETRRVKDITEKTYSSRLFLRSKAC